MRNWMNVAWNINQLRGKLISMSLWYHILSVMEQVLSRLCIKSLIVFAAKCVALNISLVIYLLLMFTKEARDKILGYIWCKWRKSFFFDWSFSWKWAASSVSWQFFISVLLFKKLSKKNIFVKGTFRKDRVGDCPLSVMKSTNRDEHQVYNAVDNGEITIGF